MTAFLRKIPLWLVLVFYMIGLLLVYLASLIGFGGKFYAGHTIGLTGLLLAAAMTVVGVYGYLRPAIMRLLRQRN